jgi:hypothetical protein
MQCNVSMVLLLLVFKSASTRCRVDGSDARA